MNQDIFANINLNWYGVSPYHFDHGVNMTIKKEDVKKQRIFLSTDINSEGKNKCIADSLSEIINILTSNGENIIDATLVIIDTLPCIIEDYITFPDGEDGTVEMLNTESALGKALMKISTRYIDIIHVLVGYIKQGIKLDFTGSIYGINIWINVK